MATRLPGFAALAIATGDPVATRLPGFAALAIATGDPVATRCARLRRAGDRHELSRR